MVNPCPYITQVEQADFGIPNATPADIDKASRLVNQYLGRPEGLIWVPDANGQPLYMAALKPTISYKLPSAIAPGQNVVIPLPFGQFGLQTIGNIAVLDRANCQVVEGCNISAAVNGSITLQSVQFAHAAGTTIDFGLQIVDELPLPSKRTTIMLTRTPVAKILAGYGRYGYDRRGTAYTGVDVATNLLAYVAAFGGPPQWTQFPLTDIDITAETGVTWIPPGLLLAYFSNVRMSYVAGWSAANLPGDIKQAVANLVSAASEACMSPNIKMRKAGNATLQRFGPTLIDDDIKAMLSSYRVKSLA